jgi:ferric-dicitrate binding protein FerR (iron transport regulator)
MKEQRLKELFHRYVNRTSTEQEDRELMYLLTDTDLTDKINELIESVYDKEPSSHTMNNIQAENILAEILGQSKLEQAPVKKMGINWKRWMAAASVILVAGLGIYFMSTNKTGQHTEIAKGPALKNDVNAPGMSKAMITLADGSTVFLDSGSQGTLAQQGKVDIVKNADGSISYSGANSAAGQKEVYNTLINPRGSKVVTLVLSDGTKVWLNAASSLEYPVAFIGNTRSVKITGEAYFEVIHNSKQPFTVAMPDGTNVEDIGTAFNINAYDNEVSSKTTLVEGAVKLTSKKLPANTVLKPGQQCNIPNKTGTGAVVNGADIEQVLAWKNGTISFHSANLQMVLNELERWYDIDVVIEGPLPERSFYAELSRGAGLSEVLKILEINNIHFSLDAANKRLVVKP